MDRNFKIVKEHVRKERSNARRYRFAPMLVVNWEAVRSEYAAYLEFNAARALTDDRKRQMLRHLVSTHSIYLYTPRSARRVR